MKLLEGVIEHVEQNYDEKEDLRTQVRSLQSELKRAHADAHAAEQQAARSVAALRKQLGPLYKALQLVFGEMDAIGDDGDVTTGGPDGRQLAILNDWKQKLPASDGKVIDALLLHNDLSVQQMQMTCKLGRQTVYAATSRLGRAGLVSNAGGRFSLKQL